MGCAHSPELPKVKNLKGAASCYNNSHSQGKNEKHAQTRAHTYIVLRSGSSAHAHHLPARRCTPRPLATALGRVRSSGARQAAEVRGCGRGRGGRGSQASQGCACRQRRPPGRVELSPALQHGGGGGGGGGRAAVSSARAAVTGAAVSARPRESVRPRPGPVSCSQPSGLPARLVLNGFIRGVRRGRAKRREIPRLRRRGGVAGRGKGKGRKPGG